MNTLIIVDPQYDFIEGGALPVEGGKQALDNIASLINSGNIDMVITTQDWHPISHCSFKENGGDFPPHCIQFSEGSNIYQPILDAIRENNICHYDYYKGTLEQEEQFSAFVRIKHLYKSIISFEMASGESLEIYNNENLIVCGLAGDICVLNTLKVLFPLPHVYVYTKGIASLDNGKTLSDYINQTNILDYDTKLN